jgi:arsenical pump membrane protein
VLTLVLWRPRGLPVAWTATGGAVLAAALGLIDLDDARALVARTGNATVALVGLMWLSATLDASGAFRAAAHAIARRSGGSGPRLFIGLGLLTAAATAFIANDGAILVLTPIVIELAELLALERAATVAFLFTIGFLCDAFSIVLPTANLTNLILVDVTRIDGGLFLARMIPASLAVLAVSLGVLYLQSRRAIPARVSVEALGAPPRFPRRSRAITIGAAVVLGAGYLWAARAHLPLGAVVLVVAAALAVAESRALGGTVPLVRTVRGLPFGVVLFANAMFLVVGAVAKRAGSLPPSLTQSLTPSPTVMGLFAVGAAVSIACAVGNNLPMFLMALGLLPAGDGTLALAALVGANIGEKLTPIGSLATLLWLDLLRRHHVTVSWGRYVTLAALPTITATLAALALLALL